MNKFITCRMSTSVEHKFLHRIEQILDQKNVDFEVIITPLTTEIIYHPVHYLKCRNAVKLAKNCSL